MRLYVLMLLLLMGHCLTALGQAPPEVIVLLPPQVMLTGPAASQRLLVEARQRDRFTGDLTRRSRFASSNPRVATVSADGTVRPVRDGAATITATVDGRTATVAVSVDRARAPFTYSFRNHVL